jgi:SPIRAL1-like protein
MNFPSEQQFRDNRSSNAFANGANQNCGNVLTDRPTTRLHAPPGGKSQISSILSWDTGDDYDSTANKRAQRDARAPAVAAPAPFGVDPMQRGAPAPFGVDPMQRGGPAPSFENRRNDYITSSNAAGGHSGVSSSAYANGANQNCGNVLTDRRTTRVSAPPGGHSSIVFG